MQAGLAEGTTYLYFATKEELLLELLTIELADWFAALLAWLDTPSGDSASSIASSGLDERPNQHPGTQPQRERDPPIQSVFARAIHPRHPPPRSAAAQCEQPRAAAMAEHLGDRTRAAQPAAAMKPILERSEFQALKVDFESALTRSLSALLRGLKEQS